MQSKPATHARPSCHLFSLLLQYVKATSAIANGPMGQLGAGEEAKVGCWHSDFLFRPLVPDAQLGLAEHGGKFHYIQAHALAIARLVFLFSFLCSPCVTENGPFGKLLSVRHVNATPDRPAPTPLQAHSSSNPLTTVTSHILCRPLRSQQPSNVQPWSRDFETKREPAPLPRSLTHSK